MLAGAYTDKTVEYIAAHEALRRMLNRHLDSLDPEVKAVLNRACVAGERLEEED